MCPPIQRLQSPRLFARAGARTCANQDSVEFVRTPKLQPNGSTCTYEDAADLIAIARHHDLPDTVLKRALYEVLRSTDFWEVVDTQGNGAVMERISQTDLLGLYAARTFLGKSWRTLCLEPPPVNTSSPRCTCTVKDMQARAKMWREQLAYALSDDLDPISYANQLRTRFVPLGGEWCDVCVKKQRSEWMKARRRWWKQLDTWFGLACEGSHAPEGNVAQ
ncbi:hypothetical protein C2E23DRAFT_461736 [Lenzites betulinus]|nr:hypothetical protein C2E23DRAFT_461736 [Lenzites betulinus]